jgi:hypothetical protein
VANGEPLVGHGSLVFHHPLVFFFFFFFYHEGTWVTLGFDSVWAGGAGAKDGKKKKKKTKSFSSPIALPWEEEEE